MLTEKLTKLADVLMEGEQNKDIDRDIIVYGLTLAIEQTAGALTSLALAVYYGLVPHCVLFLIAYSAIRTYAGGFHCQKAVNCYIFSTGMLLIVLTAIKHTPIDYLQGIVIILSIISAIIIVALAPKETPNKPMDNVEVKHFRKQSLLRLGILILVIIGLAIASLWLYSYVIALAITASSILLLVQVISDYITVRKKG